MVEIDIKYLIGEKFGKLTVIGERGKNDAGRPAISCLCDCGIVKMVSISELKRKAHTSCGNCGRYKAREKTSDHPLYQIWRGMKGRCYYKKNDSYRWYGAVGVTVCELWNKSYVAFRDWCLANGWERGMQIDKDIIPKRLGIEPLIYSPEMCTIVTANTNKRASSHVKLSVDKANDIRQSDKSDKELAVIYGVRSSIINKVRNNKMWL